MVKILNETSGRVCVCVGSRANFGRMESVIDSLSRKPVRLTVFLYGSALSERFGLDPKSMAKLQQLNVYTCWSLFESDSGLGASKTVGVTIGSFSDFLANNPQDCVVVGGDRYEIMAIAVTSALHSVKLVHLQGGELTGNVDDKIRHAVSQLADYHFPSNLESAQRLVQFRIPNDRIFALGCPGLDAVKEGLVSIGSSFLNERGSGRKLDEGEPYAVFVYHPESQPAFDEVEFHEDCLRSLLKIGIKNVVVFWPNADPGNNKLSLFFRRLLEHAEFPELNVRMYKSLTPAMYNSVLSSSRCVIGNSSSFVRECALLGVPALIVGQRQENRLLGENAVRLDPRREDVFLKLQQLLQQDAPASSSIYGDGSAGPKIASVILDKVLGHVLK